MMKKRTVKGDFSSVITIDGPVGVGKSTVARALSERLGYTYLDTGAMYRAFSLKVLRNGIPLENEKEIIRLLQKTRVWFDGNRVLLDGEDVSGAIRTKEIDSVVSYISAIPEVRRHIVAIQREIASGGKVVMEGRDCGSVVFPKAKYKFYLDASIEERVRRRLLDEKYRNQGLSPEEVRKSIELRDYLDKSRKDSPLRVPKGAILINTDGLRVEEVVDKIISYISSIR